MDYSSCCLEIIDRTGAAITEITSTKNWLDLVHGIPDLSAGEAAPVSIDEFLREEHHHYYGRPWINASWFGARSTASGAAWSRRRHEY